MRLDGAEVGDREDVGRWDMRCDSVTRTRHLRGLYTAVKLRVKELRAGSVLGLLFRGALVKNFALLQWLDESIACRACASLPSAF